MPEMVTLLQRHHELAVSGISEWLSTQVCAGRLRSADIKGAYPKRNFKIGWRFQMEFDDRKRHLDLLLTHQFPYDRPYIALVDKSHFLSWPHVESDGMLCLSAVGDDRDVMSRIKSAISDANTLVARNIAGEMREDFQHEFLSYWAQDPQTKGVKFISLLKASGPTRRIVIWRGVGLTIVAEDKDKLQSWFQNRYPERKRPIPESGALIWLPQALFPKEYPRTARDVWNLADKELEGSALLGELALPSLKRIVTVFGADTKNGPCLAGTTIDPPKQIRGFRKGHVRRSILIDQYRKVSTPIDRSDVLRADASWIHGRGCDERQEELSLKSIVIIGCGSVGAQVAIQLAMAGVGKFTFIDPEALTYANIGRHPLGEKHVGLSKVEGLGQELRQQYPHHTFSFHARAWQQVNDDNSCILQEPSLIISATGDWNSENALNTWHRDAGEKPPIIYGWTEEHACAGHAVLIDNHRKSCFICGFRNGSPVFRVTAWPDSMLKQEPGCGAVYQPYGPIELAHTVNLICELALDVILGVTTESTHRIWACRRSFLERLGGAWTGEWLDYCEQYTEGAFFKERGWPVNPKCAFCSINQ